MDSPHDAPYYCMADARCRLCRFELQEGDLVISHIGSQRFSMDLKLRMTETVHDSYEWINLHTCARRRCMMQGRRVPFFHHECFCFRLYDVSDALVAAGEWSFEPPASENSRRSHRIKNMLAPKLRDQLKIRLPPETLMTITGHFVRECAAITAEEQSLGTAVSDTAVDITQDVYAKYTAVDGVRYVKSFYNTASDSGNQDHPTLLSKKGKSIDKIWIAKDYRGIRSVIFCGVDSLLEGPTPITKSWWRVLNTSNDTKQIAIKSDGIKLRNIAISDETRPDASGNYVSWADPSHPDNIIDIMTLEPIDIFPEGLKMMSFDCNASSTTGYTAVTGGTSVAMIHAHGHGDTSFYADMDAAFPRDFFIHMPLDDGEYVTEIC
ncbi:hypothetical protein FVEG_13137 [Fusarium verticillioides 7600]|uniref:Uncharacterized protein n=1 Tax=Gibberella moniliformis (strain M3125 / FGSC 7600) TaxID=334819 RepID=W7NFN8_GIBM7|nr:hypothetical protein FVEG_13137 [Fusarium verticillioides 7600]EWG55087.1 hypothetical protein FVEG_13137 [Fusarium verticillioides 7600]